MVEPIVRSVVAKAKTDRVCELGDSSIIARKKMPMILGPRSGIAGDVVVALRAGDFRSLAGIETHDNDLELLARLELNAAEPVQQTVQHQIAQLRAAVIGEH